MKVFGINFTDIVNKHADELPREFVEFLHQAQPRFWVGLYTEAFLEAGGHINNMLPNYNLRENETITQLFTRIAEEELKPGILNSGWKFSDRARELIMNASVGYLEFDVPKELICDGEKYAT